MFQRKLALVYRSLSLSPPLTRCAAFALIFMTRDATHTQRDIRLVCLYISAVLWPEVLPHFERSSCRRTQSQRSALCAFGSLSAGLHLDSTQLESPLAPPLELCCSCCVAFAAYLMMIMITIMMMMIIRIIVLVLVVVSVI